ncbi:hypothetical protein [Marinicrinis lubricantis]|uniref:Uncharacterized protein n=1 Tax=Marinicrinis lubricantis TaxID=2086470 RepID=A0ABW1IVC9_9BACL
MKRRRKRRKMIRLNPSYDELKEIELEQSEKAAIAQVDIEEDSQAKAASMNHAPEDRVQG